MEYLNKTKPNIQLPYRIVVCSLQEYCAITSQTGHKKAEEKPGWGGWAIELINEKEELPYKKKKNQKILFLQPEREK